MPHVLPPLVCLVVELQTLYEGQLPEPVAYGWAARELELAEREQREPRLASELAAEAPLVWAAWTAFVAAGGDVAA